MADLTAPRFLTQKADPRYTKVFFVVRTGDGIPEVYAEFFNDREAEDFADLLRGKGRAVSFETLRYRP